MPGEKERGVIHFLEQGDLFCARCGNKKKFTIEWWLRVLENFEVVKDRAGDK